MATYPKVPLPTMVPREARSILFPFLSSDVTDLLARWCTPTRGPPTSQQEPPGEAERSTPVIHSGIPGGCQNLPRKVHLLSPSRAESVLNLPGKGSL